MKKISELGWIILLVSGISWADVPQADQVLKQMKRVAAWQLDQYKNGAPGGWVNATAFAGFTALYYIEQDEALEKQLLEIGENNNWDFEPGMKNYPYHADNHCHGQFAIELYLYKHNPRMIAPIQRAMDFVIENPPTCGLTHDRRKNEERWNWCDALFMAPPVLAQLFALTGEEKYLDYLDQEFWATSDYLYSPEHKLMFRDDRYFNKKTPNGSAVFWGRGNGWVYGGLARVLELYPEDRPGREKYVTLFQEMTQGILACQLESGLWPASMLDPDEVPGNEMSASAFFCYGLAWGVNHGLLDKKTYWPIALSVWDKMQGYVLEDGRYSGVQKISDRPGTFKNGGGTKPYGTGAYLLAGSQIHQQLNRKKIDKRALFAAAVRYRKSQADATQTPEGMITFMKDGGWCWYQDPRAIIQNGKLIIGGVSGQSGDVKVSVYDLKTQQDLGTVVLHEKFQRDDHNAPAFYVRPDGRLLAVYAKHSIGKIHYYRISDPSDYLKWGPEQQFVHDCRTKSGFSYMNLYYLENEELLYNFFRGGNTYNPTFITSADQGDSWGHSTHFIVDEVKDRQRPYARYMQRDPNTVGVMFTEAHPRKFGTSVYYADFRNGAFYKAGGTKIKDLADGPLKPSEAELVYQGSATHKKPKGSESVPNSAWTAAGAIDAKGYPHIGYSLYLNNNDHRFRIASWNGKKWVDREIAYAGRCLYPRESSYTGLFAFDPSDPDRVAISTDVDPNTGTDLLGKHEIYVANVRANPARSAIAWNPLTSGSTVRNIRPIIVSGEGYSVLIWLRGPWNTYTNYQSDVVGIVLKSPKK